MSISLFDEWGVALTNTCSRLSFLYGLLGIDCWINLYIQSGFGTGSELCDVLAWAELGVRGNSTVLVGVLRYCKFKWRLS